MTRSDDTIFYSLAYSNSTGVYIGLKYMYSVISVSNLSNDGLTTSQYFKKSTRLWPTRVRFFHSLAGKTQVSGIGFRLL